MSQNVQEKSANSQDTTLAISPEWRHLIDLSSHLFVLHCTESSESLVFTGPSPKSQEPSRQWQLSDHNTTVSLYPLH